MRLLLTPMLRRYGGGRDEFDVSGATVGQALEGLFGAFPDLRARVLDTQGRLHPYLRIFCNDQAAGLASPVVPGDVIEIVAAAAGG